MKPGEHKAVQARIPDCAGDIGWTLVSQKEAGQRRGLHPEATSKDRAKGVSLSLDDLLDPMRNKCATCSTNGQLHFNAELPDLDGALRDYAVVHELPHFYAPSHGRVWKSLMRVHPGECEKLENELHRVE